MGLLSVSSVMLMCLMCTGCAFSQAKEEIIRPTRIDSLELVRTGELRFILDESTSPNILTSFYDADDGFFYFFNRITECIERFHTDSTTKSPIRIKISCMPWGINTVSPDSIYLLDLNSEKIRLIDREGTPLKIYGISDDSDIMPGGQGQPYVTPYGLVYTSNTTREDYCIAIVDAENGKTTDRLLAFPGMYKDFFGNLLMCTPYTAYDSGRYLAVVGFPADDNIHVLNMATKKISVYYAGSKYKNEKLKPLGKGPLGGINVSTEKELKYFREITSYGNILHDPWRGVYYRIVEKSTPMPGTNLSNRAKRLAVLILDENFRTIGESDIAEEIYAGFRYTAFVSPDGLNIQLLTGEEELAFGTYSLKTTH